MKIQNQKSSCLKKRIRHSFFKGRKTYNLSLYLIFAWPMKIFTDKHFINVLYQETA